MASPDPSDGATAALVAYLRSEADAAEARARSLRLQIAQLSATYNISDDMQQRYEVQPDELPPMDEHGIPKYKGRKRGRKARVRKRKANPNRRKRQHTAYTLYVKEHYPAIRAEYASRPSKDIIGIVAKQWALVSADEKKIWKERALATHGEDEGKEEEEEDDAKDDDEEEAAGFEDAEETFDEEEVGANEIEGAQEEAEEDDDDDDEEPAPPARRRTRRS